MKQIKLFNNHRNMTIGLVSSMVILAGMVTFSVSSQTISKVMVVQPVTVVHPLDQITVVCETAGTLSVKDGQGREYLKIQATPTISFLVGGAAGMQTVTLFNNKGSMIGNTSFNVEASTQITDGGKIGELFNLLYKGMQVYGRKGYEEVTYKGKLYRYFVSWVLDNNNTTKGMQYFSPYSRDMVDLFRENQKPDGMIWSFVSHGDNDFQYYETAYSSLGYFQPGKDAWFVRQPVENHVEYNYVNLMYQHWKASGDNEWMKKNLSCASRALDYSVTDTLRWSKRFKLLKRPYCIDSWDFQVDDEYTPYSPISPTMLVVPGKTKFGIFFGDNTGYFEACSQLAEMFEFAGQPNEAAKYSQRGRDIFDRLKALSWNGRFFTHFIDEDPAVVRHLGVDEKSQIAQGNAYSINRGLPHDMNVAIIRTYQELRKNLPVGSPGEWYSIYPPFERGFGTHNEKWQYMNGGIAGHAIGELARGAYENGYEDYASDNMNRLLELGKKYGNKVWFSYTGSIPSPPSAPSYKTVDISVQANMNLSDKGGKNCLSWMNDTRPGNDMRNLPTGDQIFHDIKFKVIDPDKNQGRAVIAVSTRPPFPGQLEVPVNDSAATVYLLHSSSDNIPSNIAGAITFVYSDETRASRYVVKGKDVTNWWFSILNNDRAGVAWYGPNLCSTKVGVCWAAIANPNPKKKISSLIFHAPLEGGIYAVLGITLSNMPHYIKPRGESYGGPDNWAAANGMAALVEGLAGVKNQGLAFSKVTLSPRWTSSATDSVNVSICFPASNGYVAYQYRHHPDRHEIEILLTGSGNELNGHVLLPKNTEAIDSVIADGKVVNFNMTKIEDSKYADFSLSLPGVQLVKIKYR